LPACRLVFLPRHGPAHDIAPHRVNYRANLWALKAQGVDAVVAVNAVGGITPPFEPGVLALPDQVIDYTWGREHSIANGTLAPLDHVDFSQPFAPELREKLQGAAVEAGVALHAGGCIGVTQGPRLETAAEIERLRRDGCDLVGMTSMPEAALARELGLPYASICVVGNHAAGLGGEPLQMESIEARLAEAMTGVRSIIAKISG